MVAGAEHEYAEVHLTLAFSHDGRFLSSLLDADILFAHDRRPLLQFALHLGGENLGSAPDRLVANSQETFPYFGRREGGVDLAVQQIDDGFGRPGWRKQAKPDRGLETGHGGFGNRRL